MSIFSSFFCLLVQIPCRKCWKSFCFMTQEHDGRWTGWKMAPLNRFEFSEVRLIHHQRRLQSRFCGHRLNLVLAYTATWMVFLHKHIIRMVINLKTPVTVIADMLAQFAQFSLKLNLVWLEPLIIQKLLQGSKKALELNRTRMPNVLLRSVPWSLRSWWRHISVKASKVESRLDTKTEMAEPFLVVL